MERLIDTWPIPRFRRCVSMTRRKHDTRAVLPLYYKNPIKNFNRIAHKRSLALPTLPRHHRAKATAVSKSIVEHTLSHVYIMQIDSIDWPVDCTQPCRGISLTPF